MMQTKTYIEKRRAIDVDALREADAAGVVLELGLLEEGVRADSLDEVVVEEHGLDVVGHVLRPDVLNLVEAGVDECQLRFGLD